MNTTELIAIAELTRRKAQSRNEWKRGLITVGVAFLFLLAIIIIEGWEEESITRIDYQWAAPKFYDDRHFTPANYFASDPDLQLTPSLEISPQEKRFCWERYWSKGIDICTVTVVTGNITVVYTNQSQDTTAASSTRVYNMDSYTQPSEEDAISLNILFSSTEKTEVGYNGN